MNTEVLGKIIIGYYNFLGGFFESFMVTNHKYIDDLEIDLKRMVKTAPEHVLKAQSKKIIYAVGTINDETGKITNFEANQLLVQFPEYKEEVKKEA